MAPPGSLSARYERLAGDENRRAELYAARSRLGFDIDTWLRLPWWQRRLYVEGMVAEQEARESDTGPSGPALDPYDAILNGSIEDVARATGAATE